LWQSDTFCIGRVAFLAGLNSSFLCKEALNQLGW
jgi:hypothetical protein